VLDGDRYIAVRSLTLLSHHHTIVAELKRLHCRPHTLMLVSPSDVSRGPQLRCFPRYRPNCDTARVAIVPINGAAPRSKLSVLLTLDVVTSLLPARCKLVDLSECF